MQAIGAYNHGFRQPIITTFFRGLYDSVSSWFSKDKSLTIADVETSWSALDIVDYQEICSISDFSIITDVDTILDIPAPAPGHIDTTHETAVDTLSFDTRFLIRTSYPNKQNNSAASIPVYVVSNPGAGPYPNKQGNALGAIPVYKVSKPNNGPWPNDQGQANGAIPIRIVSNPGAGPYPSDQANDLAAIPVYLCSAPTDAPPYPNAQGNVHGAIPVWDIANP